MTGPDWHQSESKLSPAFNRSLNTRQYSEPSICRCGWVTFSLRIGCALMALVLASCADAGDSGLRPLPPSASRADPHRERAALAASFAAQGSGGLEHLLHDSIIVQPPSPDSAMQGAAAIRYLTNLAAHTRATGSALSPSIATPEGPFLYEQGTWGLQVAGQTRSGHYTLRWRLTPTGWKVMLWRWSNFR